MRTLSVLASLAALAIVVPACMTETEAPTTASAKKPKKGTTKSPGAENQNGEHGSNAPSSATETSGEPPAEGVAIGTETWDTGKALTTNGTITAGATVTISPGAVVNVSAGVTLTIKGTLKVTAGTTHAKMTGTGWGGLVIAEGGTLEVDGLELIGADTALRTQPGNAAATFKNGVIDADTPFNMEAGSKLAIDHVSVKAAGGSALAGTFTATHMQYDKGVLGGLTMNDPAGTMTITQSTFKGAGGGDYIISSAGKLVDLSYTTVGGSHCALHFGQVDVFKLDHVSLENNSYGAMLYGSTGPSTITASNIRANDTVDLDTQNTNGTITVTGSFMANPNNPALTIKNAVTTPIANAKETTE